MTQAEPGVSRGGTEEPVARQFRVDQRDPASLPILITVLSLDTVSLLPSLGSFVGPASYAECCTSVVALERCGVEPGARQRPGRRGGAAGRSRRVTGRCRQDLASGGRSLPHGHSACDWTVSAAAGAHPV